MKTILKRPHLKKFQSNKKVILILLMENLEESEMWGIVYANLQPYDLGMIIVYYSSTLLSIYPGCTL